MTESILDERLIAIRLERKQREKERAERAVRLSQLAEAQQCWAQKLQGNQTTAARPALSTRQYAEDGLVLMAAVLDSLAQAQLHLQLANTAIERADAHLAAAAHSLMDAEASVDSLLVRRAQFDSEQIERRIVKEFGGGDAM